MSSVARKIEELKDWLQEKGSVLIAFSGGVDSTFLLKVAFEQLQQQTVAVTAVSPVYSERERLAAQKLAAEMGVRHIILRSNELDAPGFRDNPPDRCYHCKRQLFSELLQVADREKLAVVCDGSNADDLSDYRPGRRAAQELGILSPLAELNFSKPEIREGSRLLGLQEMSLKPAAACLASRFPYGEIITEEKLKMVDSAEEVLHNLDFLHCRVRLHGTVARIEVPFQDLQRLISHAEQIAKKLRAYGFSYITVDLEGYRTGSLNEVL